MRFDQCWLTLCLLSVEVLHMSESIAVKFSQNEPLYVALGQTLVLEVQFQLQQKETIQLLTWELKNSNGEVRVAEGLTTYNNRTAVGKSGALLRIKGVVDSDYGIYKVTVTSDNGDQMSDSRQVLQITNPPTASLSMHCSVAAQGAQWDSPSFLWYVDGVKVTNETGEISEEGSLLRLVKLGHNYTCIASSSQGTSQAQVHRIGPPTPSPSPPPTPSPPPGPCHCTGLIVAVVIESITLGLLIIGGCVWYKKNNASGCAESVPNTDIDF
ncbi:hypothetical protein KOW79_018965 [Hemibagrus wyckioides]|uniref:Ig-like domain-containing protein n=1 Tax=Hemibagrus wyckioides TaxID=337641 RepID=A0A9D3SBV9_9TELE|nr:uncharacterized protein LOC131344326 [Hemibagrus wyckioides]KAG7317930.1 hypothetical protein KOW79_018965 [Hemibagrus wyckioides]